MNDLLIVILSIISFASLAGIIYPFRPFRKRRNALVTTISTFFLTGALASGLTTGIERQQSSTLAPGAVIVAQAQAETTSSTPALIPDAPAGPDLQIAPDTASDVKAAPATAEAERPTEAPVNHLKGIRNSIEKREWTVARRRYESLAAGDYDLEAFTAEIEARILELVRPIPASDYQANLEGYTLLSILQPENALYAGKVESYRKQMERARLAAVDRLQKSTDRIENLTWYEHSNQPKYLNSRSTVYLYIGRRGEDGTPFLRMNIQYTGDDWLFVENVVAWHDGIRVPFFEGSFQRDNNTSVWEWVDERPSAQQIEVLRQMAEADEAILRYEGEQYRRDVTLSTGDKTAIREVLLAYETMGGK